MLRYLVAGPITKGHGPLAIWAETWQGEVDPPRDGKCIRVKIHGRTRFSSAFGSCCSKLGLFSRLGICSGVGIRNFFGHVVESFSINLFRC